MTDDLRDIGNIVLTEGSNRALHDEMIAELKKIQELPQFLRDVMSEDIKRYFNATTPVEQLMIKGAYFRMKWILNQMTKQPIETVTGGARIKGVGRYSE